MKYTRKQFDAVVECFDDTIYNAAVLGDSHFICLSIYECRCPSYCPFYRERPFYCIGRYDAHRWQSLKEQFIIENEPED